MQELDIQQINEAVSAAVDRRIPLSLTVPSHGWNNLHSRFLVVQEEHLLVEPPVSADGAPYEFTPAEKVEISFKLKHHKYLAHARVAGVAPWTPEGGVEVTVLCLCYPTQMQRLQRRSFTRVSVPPGRIVRVTFWAGDRKAEPTGRNSVESVWSGQVVDLSAGGFQALLPAGTELPKFEPGSLVGVRVVFGPGEQSVYSDAMFRHSAARPDVKLAVGFQFVGLAHDSAGRETLRIIGQKMSEFSRVSGRLRREEAVHAV
jgi:c-di-GMP-binding flagellar brake protein YcgR